MGTENMPPYFPEISEVEKASLRLKGVSLPTPLSKNLRLSREYDAEILFKREDLQTVRSYKIRGAYNKIASLSKAERDKGVVCASAGNHAQGVAYACHFLGIEGTIFMPSTTPKQKVEQVEMFGEEQVHIVLQGDTFDDAKKLADEHAQKAGCPVIHPFDDPKVIEGQGTIGLEILRSCSGSIDYLTLPIGGGGLAAGVSGVFSHLSPHTKIIGVEPAGAPSMGRSLQEGKRLDLDIIDKFVDGAAVCQVGKLNFDICQKTLSDCLAVEEGEACQTILSLYNKDAIGVEPAGSFAVAALEQYRDKLKGKTVVVVISGSNNDISRMEEIKERALLYSGLKHYFLVNFPQRAGALKKFVVEVLGPDDDITYFQYTKKNARETGAAVVSVELKRRSDFEPLIERMKRLQFYGGYLNENLGLLQLLT
ncbi:MAG: threonine ammonia-lyase [Candidatus Eremiobacteraeota bacterium]|nr:threonine ammonia-lyase [Candidatus Eremiobacteraeota bacterium]